MTTSGVEPVFDSYRPDGRVGAETSTCSDDAIRLRDYDTRRGVRGVRNGIRSIRDLACHHLEPHQQLPCNPVRGHDSGETLAVAPQFISPQTGESLLPTNRKRQLEW
jgi:hypothetical protein